LCSTMCGNAVAHAAAPMDAATAKQKVVARGIGQGVKLVRRDGTEVKGDIVAVGADAVDVRVKGTASPVSVAFADVSAVKGKGLSTGAKVGIGVGVGVVVVVAIVAIALKHNFDNSLKF